MDLSNVWGLTNLWGCTRVWGLNRTLNKLVAKTTVAIFVPLSLKPLCMLLTFPLDLCALLFRALSRLAHSKLRPLYDLPTHPGIFSFRMEAGLDASNTTISAFIAEEVELALPSWEVRVALGCVFGKRPLLCFHRIQPGNTQKCRFMGKSA